MHIHGHLWVKNCIGPIDKGFDGLRLPASVRITLRVVMAGMPAIAGSLLSGRLSPFFTLGSVALLYLLLKPVQPQLFRLSPQERHWHVGMPLQFFMLAWALVLALIRQPDRIGRTVGALAMVTAVAVWPVYMSRKAYERKQRTVPFGSAYGSVAAVVAIQQIFIVWSSI